ncbi:MAG: hypothetical protein ACKOAY_03455 [Haliscomenobacter sp.]
MLRKTQHYLLIMAVVLTQPACQDKRKDHKAETAQVESPTDAAMGTALPADDPEVGKLDQLVDAANAASTTLRSVSSFRMLDAVGTVEGRYEGDVLRVVHTVMKSIDGLRDMQEWIYVDAAGKPLVYRELIRFERCSPQQPVPCVRESWIYLDEVGQPFASRQRSRILEDGADTAMEEQPFEAFTPESGTSTRITQAAARYRVVLYQAASGAKGSAPERAQADGQRIYFNGDATLLKGVLAGSPGKDYLLRLREAQPAAIRLQSTFGCTMDISDMDGNILLRKGTEWIGSAPRAGDMHIRVQCARTDASFTISVGEY